MSAADPLFGVRGVRVEFGDVVALDDVTALVGPGQVVAVVGGDGAGKSTLLRAVVGQLAVSAGEVLAPERGRIGFLPAGPASWSELTVRENLAFVAQAYRPPTDGRIERLEAVAGLVDAGDRLAARLSGGMRRKLGFVMAALPDPALLVLDEPSTGVDPVSRVDLWRLIAGAAAAGAAVLMSTTYLDEAERATSLVALDAGRVLVAGTPEQAVGSLRGVVTEAADPVRSAWSWRRGRDFHEYWPVGVQPPSDATIVPADLEDTIIALSLEREVTA